MAPGTRTTRAGRPDVRNPVLALPACQRIQELPPESRQALRALLLDLSADARARADHSWRTAKGPMAVYWRSISVYARHIARLL